MILAIDCGNTHTVFGTITKEGEIQKIFRMESSRRKTSYEYAADIAQICQLLEIDLQGLEGSILPLLYRNSPPLIRRQWSFSVRENVWWSTAVVP